MTITDNTTMEETVIERIDQLVLRADELLALTVDGRTMFSATEVLDFALDARVALVEARNQIAPATLNN